MRFLSGCKQMLISLLVVLFSVSVPMSAQAAFSESGTLSVHLQNRDCNVELAVYRVADYCDGEFALLPELEETGKAEGINLTQLKTASDIQKAMDFFGKQIHTQNIPPAYQDYTSEGKLFLGAIPTGMYLVMQIPHQKDRVSVQSFLVSVPCRDVVAHGEGEESALVYDVECYPKEESAIPYPEEPGNPDDTVKTGDHSGRKMLVYGCLCLAAGSMIRAGRCSKIGIKNSDL